MAENEGPEAIPPFEGKEVHYSQEPHKEVVSRREPGKEVVQPPRSWWSYYHRTERGEYLPGGDTAKDTSSRICRLRPKVFWILFGVAILLIAAAIGAGVGGSIAAQSSNNSSANSSSAKHAKNNSTRTKSTTTSSGVALTNSASGVPTLPPLAPGAVDSLSEPFAIDLLDASRKPYANQGPLVCGGNAPCEYKLKSGHMVTSTGYIQYITCEWGIESTTELSEECVKYSRGFSILKNGSLAVGDYVQWYGCEVPNTNAELFIRPYGGNCRPIFLQANKTSNAA